MSKLIINEDLKSQLELSRKASKLSDNKINFVISVIDLLKDLDNK